MIGVPQVKDLQLGEAGAIGAVIHMLSPGSQWCRIQHIGFAISPFLGLNISFRAQNGGLLYLSLWCLYWGHETCKAWGFPVDDVLLKVGRWTIFIMFYCRLFKKISRISPYSFDSLSRFDAAKAFHKFLPPGRRSSIHLGVIIAIAISDLVGEKTHWSSLTFECGNSEF